MFRAMDMQDVMLIVIARKHWRKPRPQEWHLFSLNGVDCDEVGCVANCMNTDIGTLERKSC